MSTNDPTTVHSALLNWRVDDPSKADGLNSSGHHFLSLFRDMGNDNDIEQAITAFGQAASCLLPDDPRLGGFLNNAGLGYLERYEKFGRLDDLQAAISIMKKGIATTADDHPGLPPQLCNLGNSLSHRFRRSRDLNDVSEAIRHLKRAVQLTPNEHATLITFLLNLGSSFCDRSRYTGDPNDVSEGIKYVQRAVQLIPDGHIMLPTCLQNLGISFFYRFLCTGDIDDISKSIYHHQRAVKLTPDEDVCLPSRLSNLAQSFSYRFGRTGDMQDLSNALDAAQRGVHLATSKHPDLPRWLNNLGLLFLRRFERTAEVGNISEAIKLQQRAVQLTADGSSDLANNLHNLGELYLRRFERIGDMDDLSEALKLHNRAVQLSDGHPDLPSFLNGLGTLFARRFERTRDRKDISEAIQHHQRAVELTPVGHADLPGRLNNLGLSFSYLFKSTGDMSDISKAIEHLQRGVQLTPDNHPDLPSRYSNLTIASSYRFERTGDMNDISEAIQHGQNAVRLTPDGHSEMPAWLDSLGTALSRRFERTGDLDDISEAIKHLRRAVQLTPNGRVYLPIWLGNLGNSLILCFQHTGDVGDRSEAMKYQKLALQLTPDGDAHLPGRLGNLGTVFACGPSNLEDISEAIKLEQHACQVTPDGDPGLPHILNNLGLSLTRRFEITRDLNDISEAIKIQQHAIQLTPDGHAYLTTYLGNVGDTLLHRFYIDQDLDYFTKAVSSYRLAALSTGSPSSRLQNAEKWAHLSLLSSSHREELLDAYTYIFQLLSVVSGLESTVQRRHETLADFSQLPINAAAAALSLGHPDKALEWLMAGRCIVWNQLNQLRTPVAKLRAHDRALADRFSAVANELENAGSSSKSETNQTLDSRISLEEQAKRRMKLAKEWDELLVTIRNIPGLEDFLQPKRCADIMRNLPDEGAVVVINIHGDRCDALALMAGADKPLHIPLPNFSFQEAVRLARGLRRHLLRRGVTVSRIGLPLDDHPLPDVDLVEVLGVLWNEVVWPILLFLSFSEPDTGTCAPKPRIWWCPTGILAILPIHASGNYAPTEGRPKQCLSDFAVSSYIPTVNGLFNTSESRSTDGSNGMLIISQPNTPGKAQLLGAVVEANRVAAQLEKRRILSRTLVDRDGTVKDVLETMESFSSIHLACHASQNTTSPLKSSINLYDGPLELSEIMKKNLPIANFAFLSACETSITNTRLPEEVVHLAAGMLAAGYRSVVGTMWPIVDQHGGDIAEFFYESLLEDCHGRTSERSTIDATRAARALDHAVRRFREKVSDSPEFLHVWVPYIHLGV